MSCSHAENPHSQPGKSFFLADALFILLSALFAWCCYGGILEISASGAILDSDLQTYAQGMAQSRHLACFQLDPVLRSISAGNSIPNLQRWLGVFLTPDNAYGVGLLRAGAIAIFTFYAGWYLLGRWLYKIPAFAAILSVCAGITVWVGWGTFWGITHSDPVPRVFFAALFPFLLLLFFIALRKIWLRPATLFLAGLCVWVHGISALNCGAMFFTAFFFIKTADSGWKKHGLNLILCLAAFFLPVLIYLWPSLFQAKSFSAAEMDMFREVFQWRWRNDYSNFFPRLLKFFSLSSAALPILAGGLLSWLLLLFFGKGKLSPLVKAIPCFALAIFCVATLCWLEQRLAPDFGRLPMGHELIRGMRFLVPLSWLLIVGATTLFAGKIFRRLGLAVIVASVFYFGADRQLMAAQYYIATHLHIPQPLFAEAQKEKREAELYREALENVSKFVPCNEAVFSDTDEMAVRFLAHRSLSHIFKDGYIHFYNKDAAGSAAWLKTEKSREASGHDYLRMWLNSDADWLFTRKADSELEKIRRAGEVVYAKNGFILARKTGSPAR